MLARVLRKYVRASVRYKKKVGWDESCVVVEGNQEIVGHSRAWTYKRTGGKVFKLSSPRRLGKGKKGGGGHCSDVFHSTEPRKHLSLFPLQAHALRILPARFLIFCNSVSAPTLILQPSYSQSSYTFQKKKYRQQEKPPTFLRIPSPSWAFI